MTTETIDPNAWYALSETRVDLPNVTSIGHQLQEHADAPNGLRVWTPVSAQMWQFQPLSTSSSNNIYALRARTKGPTYQLDVCWNATETDVSKSRACLREANSALQSQKWQFDKWGDGSFRVHNVGNGTAYALDVHPGGYAFLSSVVEGVNVPEPQVAQHWVISSMAAVNDAGYSTTAASRTTTAVTTATDGAYTTIITSDPSSPSSAADTTPTPSSEPSSSGLSNMAAAGLGVGITVGVIAIAAVLFWFWYRKRKARTAAPAGYAPPPQELGGGGTPHGQYTVAASAPYGGAAAWPAPPASSNGAPWPPPSSQGSVYNEKATPIELATPVTGSDGAQGYYYPQAQGDQNKFLSGYHVGGGGATTQMHEAPSPHVPPVELMGDAGQQQQQVQQQQVN